MTHITPEAKQESDTLEIVAWIREWDGDDSDLGNMVAEPVIDGDTTPPSDGLEWFPCVLKQAADERLADLERQLATVTAERDALRVDAELQRELLIAAKELPHGFIVSVHVERGAGWVEMIDPESDAVSLPDAAEKTLAEQVRAAIDAARGANVEVSGDPPNGGASRLTAGLCVFLKGTAMEFDDIPENLERSEPCNCGGKITERKDGSGKWECNTCEWVSALSYPTGAKPLLVSEEIDDNWMVTRRWQK